MLSNIDEHNNCSVASNSGDFIYMISKPEKVYNVDGGQVRYSFIIPKDIFAGTDFNAIGLYTQSASISDLTDYAAYCKVNIENSGSQGAVLVVDWDLYITNNTRTQ
jgi:hypothetical protein